MIKKIQLSAQHGCELSSIVAGAMRLGSWGARFGTKEMTNFVQQSIELGITTFDHADIYGHYTTESDFGNVLATNKHLRKQMQIVTKCGICMVSDNRKHHAIKSYNLSREHIIWSVENSLQQLQTDYVDLLLLHRPDYLLHPDEVAEAFGVLQQSGKVLFFGTSNFSPSQFAMLQSRTNLVTNQIEFSLQHLQPLHDGTFDQCLQQNIHPMIWSPLGGGGLLQNNAKLQQIAQQIGNEIGANAEQVVLAWTLRHPVGVVPVVGTTKVQRLAEAVAATDINLSAQQWYMLLEAITGKEVA